MLISWTSPLGRDSPCTRTHTKKLALIIWPWWWVNGLSLTSVGLTVAADWWLPWKLTQARPKPNTRVPLFCNCFPDSLWPPCCPGVSQEWNSEKFWPHPCWRFPLTFQSTYRRCLCRSSAPCSSARQWCGASQSTEQPRCPSKAPLPKKRGWCLKEMSVYNPFHASFIIKDTQAGVPCGALSDRDDASDEPRPSREQKPESELMASALADTRGCLPGTDMLLRAKWWLQGEKEGTRPKDPGGPEGKLLKGFFFFFMKREGRPSAGATGVYHPRLLKGAFT